LRPRPRLTKEPSTMATGTQGNTGRQTQYQMVHPLRLTVNNNDGGIANGVGRQWLPAGAIIVGTDVMVDTVFNAGTTNVLTLGTNGPSTYDNIVAAADVNEGATGLTRTSSRPAPRSASSSRRRRCSPSTRSRVPPRPQPSRTP